MKYEVNVSAKLYAKYYFELRDLLAEQTQHIFYLLPISERDGKRLETRSNAFATKLKLNDEENRRRSYDQYGAHKKQPIVLSS